MKKTDARSLPRDAQEELRRQAIRLLRQKFSVDEISSIVGVAVSTVGVWIRKFRAEGEKGLESKRRGRKYLSGRTLNLAQEWHLRSVIVGQNPMQMQLPFALWNRRAVMELIKQLGGIEMPIRTVGEYLLRWGYTPQRPTKRALEQDSVAVETWMKTTYPKIAARAKAESALIYWGDETAVAEDGHWVRGYAPAGRTPVLAQWTTRHGLTMISAVTNQGLAKFEFIQGAMNAQLFIEFMARLIQEADRKIFLIVDNLRVHHAKLVTEWLSENKERIELFYLPPYSPELNPDEYLNRDLKTELRTGSRSKTKSALLRKAQAFMERISSMPERVKSYFRFGPVSYAQAAGI